MYTYIYIYIYIACAVLTKIIKNTKNCFLTNFNSEILSILQVTNLFEIYKTTKDSLSFKQKTNYCSK